jgi:hypothetical protein
MMRDLLARDSWSWFDFELQLEYHITTSSSPANAAVSPPPVYDSAPLL